MEDRIKKLEENQEIILKSLINLGIIESVNEVFTHVLKKEVIHRNTFYKLYSLKNFELVSSGRLPRIITYMNKNNILDKNVKKIDK